ncbi:MAG: carboxypeptidase-like regulatory domain-containing protein [Candidatus Aminicenantes bacterium]|nr:carboxypeptidase-like regulatory domain-containing protein [Candidatus Aminicenantes bacterium]
MLAQVREKACLQPAIRGKIADLLDYPVVSARVVLSGAKLEDKLSSVTGKEGIFMFCRIPPGSYTLEVNYNGFSKLVQRGIAVRDHTITGLDLKMDFLEDSRTIKLRAMALEYFNDTPPITATLPSDLPRQLSEVVAELSLDRALFNPPAALKVGRALNLELGVYQNLIGEIMHRLLERNICCVDRGRLGVTLEAQLEIEGCEV